VYSTLYSRNARSARTNLTRSPSDNNTVTDNNKNSYLLSNDECTNCIRSPQDNNNVTN